MALSKLHQQGIMTGHVNHFCFACERQFMCEKDAYAHVDMPVHVKNMKTVAYFEKFSGDNIRKVKCGYFCEFCNIFLKSTSKVAMHVQEQEHIINKGHSSITRGDNGILIDKVLIGENVWHGIIDGTCALCNADFDDEDIHKNLPTHIINLVGSKLEFGPNGIIYRRVDATSFHCLTCNVVCLWSSLSQHSSENEHKEKIEKHNMANTSAIENGKTLPENNLVENVESYSEILSLVPVFQKNDVNVDFVNDSAFCKKCNETIKLDIKLLNEHILQHRDIKNETKYPRDFDGKCHELHTKTESSMNREKEVKEDASKGDTETHSDSPASSKEADASEPKDIIKFAKDNHLTFNTDECNAFCKVCKVKMPSAIKCLTEHVKGKIHQKNVAYILKTMEVVPKIPIEEFAVNVISFEGIFHHNIVINHKYCIALSSLMVLTILDKNKDVVCCNLCNQNFNAMHALEFHIKEESHKKALQQTCVVTSLPDDFIREIRPGMYHCGYCNKLYQNWPQVKRHIVSADHEREKLTAHNCLRVHMRELAEEKQMRLIRHFFERFC